MKVKELIAQLLKQDQEMDIYAWDWADESYAEPSLGMGELGEEQPGRMIDYHPGMDDQQGQEVIVIGPAQH